MTMGQVHIAFFKDFQMTDTLLMDGDREGLGLLVQTLHQLAAGPGDPVALHELPFVNAHHGIRVFVLCTSRDSASIRGGEITWERSAAGWKDAAAMVAMLMQGRPGHQYLDAEHDDIMLMASTGEYSDNWWRKNG